MPRYLIESTQFTVSLFNTIYRKWSDGQTFRPALIHLLCVCIGADSGDSVDSTFSVTAGPAVGAARAVSQWLRYRQDGTGVDLHCRQESRQLVTIILTSGLPVDEIWDTIWRNLAHFGKKLTIFQFSTFVNENIVIVIDSGMDI